MDAVSPNRIILLLSSRLLHPLFMSQCPPLIQWSHWSQRHRTPTLPTSPAISALEIQWLNTHITHVTPLSLPRRRALRAEQRTHLVLSYRRVAFVHLPARHVSSFARAPLPRVVMRGGFLFCSNRQCGYSGWLFPEGVVVIGEC